MSRITLFEPPSDFMACVNDLGHDLGEGERGRELARLLLHVELGFSLMERLRFDDEPVTAAWAVLSGMPLRHPRLQSLDAAERRAIANARQIVPYSSRFAWLEAVRSYFRLPARFRQYRLDEWLSPADLDQVILSAIRVKARDQIKDHLYERCLGDPLRFHRRTGLPPVRAGMRYEFTAKLAENPKEHIVPIEFDPQQLDDQPPLPVLFNGPRPRGPFVLDFPKLRAVARSLDEREQALVRRGCWDEAALGGWVGRLNKIALHPIQKEGYLGPVNPEVLVLDGFYHLAGMVASGKSTLSLLIAAQVIQDRPEDRLTLVVSDAQSAIRWANLINWWFLEDPESDVPVAVPLLGRSSRDKHLRDFHVSQDYLDHQRREQPHWGERWLGTACALQGLIAARDIAEMGGQTIIPGREPCQSIKKTTSNQRRGKGASHLCPYFARCPSQQVYRDIPLARVWITTPGGMALGGLPRHLEQRAIHFGEMVYEQSSLVIFDEADTVVNWFDNVYAEEVKLTGGEKGLFDSLGVYTEVFSRGERVPFAGTQRWAGAERGSQTAITALLTLLDKREGQPTLRDWVVRGHFTPNTLFFNLARRIVGLEEFDPTETTAEQIKTNKARTQPILSCFEALLGDGDPLLLEAAEETSPEYSLSLLMRDINAVGNSAFDDRIHQNCREWIVKNFPDTEHWQQGKREERVRSGRKNNADPVDTLATLAYRLQFALTVALLDRHTRIVFYEWHNRPSSVEDERQPHRGMPAALLDVLPLPPTGRQFGTYYSRGVGANPDDEGGSDNSLSLFAYTNIGRCYVLNFHRLLTDYDGQSGPAALALSGTSYLPASTRFHVGKPHGVLTPDPNAGRAIASSRFQFLPQYSADGKEIRISGVPETQKPGMFGQMVRALVGRGGSGPLGQKLEELRGLALSDSVLWQDRERLLLLVNSYDQAKWAAHEMRSLWPSLSGQIYHLERTGQDGQRDEAIVNTEISKMGLHRTDIESFSQTGGKILIAPMNAIGRGHNILNKNRKAAFGAAYFLTRPYPHPHDTQAIAQEVNRRALDWVEDENFPAWQEGDGVLGRAEAVRRLAAGYWRSAEQRTYYKTLRPEKELGMDPRKDLAATTAGLIIQAVGRLVRGGVPFYATFVDAAWGPNNAKRSSEEEGPEGLDTPETSLLAAIIELLCEDYADKERDPIGHALYAPLADALATTENFSWQPIGKRKDKNI